MGNLHAKIVRHLGSQKQSQQVPRRMAFLNCLSTTLCQNPLEFESLQNQDDEVHYLFTIADILMNPLSKLRTPDDIVPTIKNVLGGAIQLPEITEVLELELKKINNVKLKTIDDILDLKPQELFDLIDKKSKNMIGKEQGSGEADKFSKITKFQQTSNEGFLQNVTMIQERPTDVFQFILDLVQRVMIKTQVKIKKSGDNILAQLKAKLSEKSTIQQYHALIQNKDEIDFLKTQTKTIEKQSDVDSKVDKIIEIAMSNDITGMCEVSQDVYLKLNTRIEGSGLKIQPESWQIQQDASNYITAVLYTEEFILHSKQYVSDRILCLMFMPRFKGYFNLNIVHLASGNSVDTRLSELKKLHEMSTCLINESEKQKERNTTKIIMGDFNDEMDKENQVTKAVFSQGYKSPKELPQTVNKCRSAMQQQVSKMRFADMSCKDAILANIDLEVPYMAKKLEISDHAMVQIE